MAETTTPAAYQSVNDEEYINKMYDSNLASQKQTLQQGYDQNISNLDAEKQAGQRQTDANLNRTYVESQKAQKGYNEVQNAYGLTSGAMSQARLAQDNQLQADLTALRATQQTADAEIERQRSLLAKEYASAIAKAQADNDMQRAQALYEAAKADEDRLLQLQKEAGNLMASKNDYSILGQLYGLTPEQIATLQGTGGGGGGGGYDGSSGGRYTDSGDSASTQDDSSDDGAGAFEESNFSKLLTAAKTMSVNGASDRTVQNYINAAANAGTITQDERKSLKYVPDLW